MKEPKNIVTLVANGREYSGWNDLHVERSIENTSSSFEFDSSCFDVITRKKINLALGSPCEIYFDEDKILTGWLEDKAPSYDKESQKNLIKGRSKTCDVVDCAASISPGQFNNMKMELIAAQLAAEYNVTVQALVDTGDKIPKHTVLAGETVHESIDRLCRMRSLLSTDDENGNWIFTRAGQARSQDQIKLGVNIKQNSGEVKSSVRFSDYDCHGQRRGHGKDHGRKISQSYGYAKDELISRYRKHTVIAEEEATDERCRKRAEWEAATKAGRSIQFNPIVFGWYQSDGTLWLPNEIVHLTDERVEADDDFLIANIKWSKGKEHGAITSLALMPIEGFLPLIPLNKKTTVKTYWPENKLFGKGGAPSNATITKQQIIDAGDYEGED